MSAEESSGPRRRYPIDFEEWPRDQQVLKVDDRYRREGIIEEVFAVIGYKLGREIGTDTKLKKVELAALKCALEGIPFEEGVVDKYHRRGLIDEILCLTGYSTHDGVGDESRLTTKELAAAYLTLEGFDHDG